MKDSSSLSLWQKISTLHASPVACIKLFALGAVLFFCGMGTFIWVDQNLEPSLQQELVALLGLATGMIGFGSAILAQVNMVIGRLKKPSNK
jgi:hypothetical protein